MSGRLRTYDPLLRDCRRLKSLADPEESGESTLLIVLLVAWLGVLVVLGWAAWTSEQAIEPEASPTAVVRPNTNSRSMP